LLIMNYFKTPNELNHPESLIMNYAL